MRHRQEIQTPLCTLLLLCSVGYLNGMKLCSPLKPTHAVQITHRAVSLYPQRLSMCTGAHVPRDPHNRETLAHKPPLFLQLDTGMRISRIITVSTNSYTAMLKISRTVSRREIMKICLFRHKRTCWLTEHNEIPASSHEPCTGWRYGHRQGAPVHANSGTPSSVLWIVGEDPFCKIRVMVGSWLLAIMNTEDPNQFTSLFSPSISRASLEAQPITLVRPGFADPDLVHLNGDLRWVWVFIELCQCDELGAPINRY